MQSEICSGQSTSIKKIYKCCDSHAKLGISNCKNLFILIGSSKEWKSLEWHKNLYMCMVLIGKGKGRSEG
jgi:hypothetical protein